MRVALVCAWARVPAPSSHSLLTNKAARLRARPHPAISVHARTPQPSTRAHLGQLGQAGLGRRQGAIIAVGIGFRRRCGGDGAAAGRWGDGKPRQGRGAGRQAILSRRSAHGHVVWRGTARKKMMTLFARVRLRAPDQPRPHMRTKKITPSLSLSSLLQTTIPHSKRLAAPLACGNVTLHRPFVGAPQILCRSSTGLL
jgi:hypothetical protein